MRKTKPIHGKYNTLQKISYVLVPVLIAFMAWTGFSLYGPYLDNSWIQGNLEMVGGPQNMRIIHYFGMWVMVMFTLIHAYLSSIYGLGPAKLMLWGKESPGLEIDSNGNIVGDSE